MNPTILLVHVAHNKPEHIHELYAQLAERTPEQSISHKRMPSLNDHARFVLSNPYRAWYLITAKWEDDTGTTHSFIGNIYLTDRREVGIHIRNVFRGKGYGTQALNLMRTMHPGRLLANINPKNNDSIAFFTKHGARHIQNTYALD